MTKKEEQAIDKKYAEGKGTYINAETEKKMIRKQEQQKTKREKNRIRKICKQTMIEEQMLIEKLTQENKELKARNEYLEKLKDKDSDISVEEPVEEEKHLIEYDELDKYFPDEIEQSDFDRLSDDCKQKIQEKAEKENLEFEKNIFENCSSEKRQTEIMNLEKLAANFDNEMKDYEEDIEEIVEEKPIQKPIEEKPDNKNSDIPSFVEDRFQEFINKKYFGPAEATILWCGLNEIPSHNPPKFKANGYIPCERNTTKNEKGNTPQQIIVARIIDQMQQQHIEIINEKLKEKFYKTLKHMVK